MHGADLKTPFWLVVNWPKSAAPCRRHPFSACPRRRRTGNEPQRSSGASHRRRCRRAHRVCRRAEPDLLHSPAKAKKVVHVGEQGRAFEGHGSSSERLRFFLSGNRFPRNAILLKFSEEPREGESWNRSESVPRAGANCSRQGRARVGGNDVPLQGVRARLESASAGQIGLMHSGELFRTVPTIASTA